MLKMNVLITGGAGFIGSFTKDLLKKNGHQIFLVDNLVTGKIENVEEDEVFIEGDIRDEATLAKLRTYSFDAIIHLAAQTSVPASMANPLYDLSENLEGTVKILMLAKEIRVKKFIFASSAAVYGDNDHCPLVETDRLIPTSPYGITKMGAESYISVFCKEYGIEPTILRYANVFGPKQSKDGEGGVIKIFIDKLQLGENPTIYGDGNQTRDFIYVGDIARAHLAALNGPKGLYNVSSHTETSVNELIEILKEISEKQFVPQYSRVREGDIYRSCLDHTKIKENLKWSPQISLREGLTRTYKALSTTE
jgi:UDP-glucose 4-epimerase